MRAKGWFLTLFSLAVMFGTVLGLRYYQRFDRAGEADRLYAAGEFEAAETLYRELENAEGVQRCEDALREQRYLEAQRLLEVGDYENAAALLKPLGEYKESKSLLRDCDFLRANALAESGEVEQARRIYQTLGDYPGCEEALKALIPALYDRAMELAKEGEAERACTLWRECGDYKYSRKYFERGERALTLLADGNRKKLNDPLRRFDNPFNKNTYLCDEAYIIFPEEANKDTRFFLYFPGGRDEELYTEFLYYYLANPAPNTLAVFLIRNDLPDMEGCCKKGLRVLDEAAADCGLFVAEALAAGSSLGAYPALQCPIVARRDYSIRIPCVLSLDAGNAWDEPDLIPTVAQCRELAQIGTHIYLFQPIWVDISYPPVARMVNSGCWVMHAGCLHDDHEQISYDVLGMGVIDWALGDREGHCPGEIFTFRRLKRE